LSAAQKHTNEERGGSRDPGVRRPGAGRGQLPARSKILHFKPFDDFFVSRGSVLVGFVSPDFRPDFRPHFFITVDFRLPQLEFFQEKGKILREFVRDHVCGARQLGKPLRPGPWETQEHVARTLK